MHCTVCLQVTGEMLERKVRRRERNKVAAQKCRTKKKERADELEEVSLIASSKKTYL